MSPSTAGFLNHLIFTIPSNINHSVILCHLSPLSSIIFFRSLINYIGALTTDQLRHHCVMISNTFFNYINKMCPFNVSHYKQLKKKAINRCLNCKYVICSQTKCNQHSQKQNLKSENLSLFENVIYILFKILIQN